MHMVYEQVTEFGTEKCELLWTLPGELWRKNWHNKEDLTSRPFPAPRGVTWSLTIYPNGIRDDSKGYCSVYLRLKATRDPSVHATFRFFLLDDKSGRHIAESTVINRPNRFVLDSHEYSWGYPKFLRYPDLMMVVEGSVTLKCLVSHFVQRVDAPVPFVQEPRSELQECLLRLVTTGSHADLQIQVNGTHFNLHKSVVASRCPVLYTTVKSYNGDEKPELTLENVSIASLECAFAFIYCGNLVLPGDAQQSSPATALELMHLGQTWQLERLHKLALSLALSILSTENALCFLQHPLCDAQLYPKAIDRATAKLFLLPLRPEWNLIKQKHPKVIADLLNSIVDKYIPPPSPKNN